MLCILYKVLEIDQLDCDEMRQVYILLIFLCCHCALYRKMCDCTRPDVWGRINESCTKTQWWLSCSQVYALYLTHFCSNSHMLSKCVCVSIVKTISVTKTSNMCFYIVCFIPAFLIYLWYCVSNYKDALCCHQCNIIPKGERCSVWHGSWHTCVWKNFGTHCDNLPRVCLCHLSSSHNCFPISLPCIWSCSHGLKCCVPSWACNCSIMMPLYVQRQ